MNVQTIKKTEKRIDRLKMLLIALQHVEHDRTTNLLSKEQRRDYQNAMKAGRKVIERRINELYREITRLKD